MEITPMYKRVIGLDDLHRHGLARDQKEKNQAELAQQRTGGAGQAFRLRRSYVREKFCHTDALKALLLRWSK